MWCDWCTGACLRVLIMGTGRRWRTRWLAAVRAPQALALMIRHSPPVTPLLHERVHRCLLRAVRARQEHAQSVAVEG